MEFDTINSWKQYKEQTNDAVSAALLVLADNVANRTATDIELGNRMLTQAIRAGLFGREENQPDLRDVLTHTV